MLPKESYASSMVSPFDGKGGHQIGPTCTQVVVESGEAPQDGTRLHFVPCVRFVINQATADATGQLS